MQAIEGILFEPVGCLAEFPSGAISGDRLSLVWPRKETEPIRQPRLLASAQFDASRPARISTNLRKNWSRLSNFKRCGDASAL